MAKNSSLITLGEILRLSSDHLVPQEPISLYRYVELLLQLALLRKYRFSSILETGPGTYPVFGVWPRGLYERGTIVDYNEGVLAYCDRVLAGQNIDRILLDFDCSGAVSELGGKWDLVVSNGVIEHLRNDADHIRDIHAALNDGGMVICVTVLHQRMFNDWDRAVGHYRRYEPQSLISLFNEFSTVQYIPTSYIQEIVRPLFFGRIRHLLGNSTEYNNRRFGDEVPQFSRPPYAKIFGAVRWVLPAYLCLDWWLSPLRGGIAIIVARK
jgi:SAM-dependent methyltransferase